MRLQVHKYYLSFFLFTALLVSCIVVQGQWGHAHYPKPHYNAQRYYMNPQPVITNNGFRTQGNYFIGMSFSPGFNYFPAGSEIKEGENNPEVIQKNKIYEEDVFIGDVKHSQIKNAFLSSKILYNSFGKPVEIQFFHEKRVQQRNRLFYDSTNQLVSEFVEYGEDSASTVFYEFEYDSTGKESCRYISNVDTSDILQIKNSYDPNNNKVMISLKFNDQNFVVISESKFDSQNRIIEYSSFKKTNNQLLRYTYDYSESGLTKNMYDESDSLKVLKNIFEYNSIGKLIKVTNYPIEMPMNFHWLNGTVIMFTNPKRDKTLGTEITYNIDGTLAAKNYSIGKKMYRNCSYVYFTR